MDPIIAAFADFCAGLADQALPDEVVRCATDRLVDTIGCAIGGYDCTAARIGRNLAPQIIAKPSSPQRPGGERPARWLGAAAPVTTIEAAGFVNSAMIRYLDFNDTYPGGHPSDALGPVLAAADATDADGPALIRAVVAGYEIFIRLAASARLRELGWDQGFGVGLATAGALASLFGLDAATTAHALSIAAVSIMPMRATRAGELSLWKGAATALAAREATFATLLARDGMTGPSEPITGRHGLQDLVTGAFEIAPFGTGKDRFLILRTKTKYWPVEYNLQAVVWAAIELRERCRADEIESVEIETYWSAWHETASEPAKWDPRTRETADHSMPYALARALVDGQLDLTAFEERAYLDPALRPLMRRITVRVADDIEAAFPASTQVRATALTTAGQRLRVAITNPLGDHRNPLTGEQLDDKFRRLVAPATGTAAADSALTALRAIAECTSIRPALDSLALPPETASANT